jgi:DNA-binding HxlR family transcriptional regulator
MKRLDVKSSCPFNFTTEAFGDAWSFLILRDMAVEGKTTFGEFLAADERIGRSVLAERLTNLERRGVITTRECPSDKRRVHYVLAEEGIKALPLLYELGAWGSEASTNPSASKEWFNSLQLERTTVLRAWERAIRLGSSFQDGPDSVVVQLGLSKQTDSVAGPVALAAA